MATETKIITKDPNDNGYYTKRERAQKVNFAQIQEIIQRNPEESVADCLTGESGPDHNKEFTVEVRLNSNVIGVGCGSSKRAAEQAAAREGLKLFGAEDPLEA